MEVMPGGVGEVRALSTVDGGTAISTTKVRVLVPEGVEYITAIGVTYNGAKVAQLALVPYLTLFITEDGGTTFVDESSDAQDNSDSTDVTLSSFDSVANGGYIYIGCSRKFGGVTVDVDAANGTASVMSGYYWDGAQWQNASITDGTASGGATLAQDGDITWTVPTAWRKSSAGNSVVGIRKLYWMRLQVTADLDSSTTQNSWWAIPRYSPGEYLDGQAFESAVTPGPYGIVAIQAETDAGTASLIVNGYCGELEEL